MCVCVCVIGKMAALPSGPGDLDGLRASTPSSLRDAGVDAHRQFMTFTNRKQARSTTCAQFQDCWHRQRPLACLAFFAGVHTESDRKLAFISLRTQELTHTQRQGATEFCPNALCSRRDTLAPAKFASLCRQLTSRQLMTSDDESAAPVWRHPAERAGCVRQGDARSPRLEADIEPLAHPSAADRLLCRGTAGEQHVVEPDKESCAETWQVPIAHDASGDDGPARSTTEPPIEPTASSARSPSFALPAAPSSMATGNTLGLHLQPRAGQEAHARWAARRARHVPWDEQLGRGSAEGTHDALKRAARRTLVCMTPGCHALVDRGRARFQAFADRRGIYLPGDGCAGPTCSSSYQPPRFAARQREMAAQLERGERELMAWQSGLDDTETWLYSAEATREAVAAARLALERAPTHYKRRRRVRARSGAYEPDTCR